MLSRLFPNASKNKSNKTIDNILYICLVEFGWSFEHFQKTPIPIIMRLIKKHNEIQKKKNKKK